MMRLLEGHAFHVASHGIAAAYAGWLLRQFGAEVTHETTLDPEGIGAFLGEGAAFTREPSRRGPGTLITDLAVNDAARSALAAEAASRPVVWITPWGADGEWSERPWSDLALYAAGGWMSAVGDPGREPLGPPTSLAQYTGGLYAAIAALAAPARATSGLIEVPLIEAVVATLIYDPVAFQYYGTIRARAGNRFSLAQPTLATLPCKDGYIGLHCALHGQFVTLCRLIGYPELVSDPRFAVPADRAANVAELDTYLLPWFAERTRWQAYHELQAHRIPCAAMPDMAEVLASPQLAAREAWHDVGTPSGRNYRMPGAPARVQAETAPAPQARSRPLKVVDLSMGWAGPMVGYILAALGADIVKVESHTHFDWWRGSRPPGDDPGLGLHERSHVFNAANRGKRGVSLNLAAPRGRDLALALMAEADLVIENYGTGVMEKLGLSYEAVAERNPGVVMVRLPGFGSTGPEGHYLSFGNTIEGMSGLSSLMGYPGGPPTMMSNATGDPIGGLTGTVAALAAIHSRDADGRGRLVECAQLEGFLPLVSEGLLEYQQTGVVPPRRGNQRAKTYLSGVFRCAGEDEWTAIEIPDEAAWQRLAAIAALPGGDPEEELAGWAQARSREEVTDICLAAGIAASPINNEADVLALEPLLSSDFWHGVERVAVGFHQYPGIPIRFPDGRPVNDRPAPTLGQHTAEVLATLGLTHTDLESLHAEGVIGTTPAG